MPMTYLAEVYWDREFQLQQQGFDFTYDKRLLDRLHHGDPDEARGHLQADPGYSAKLARFLENHDEAAQRRRVRPSHPRRRGARPSRCRGCASSSTDSSKGRRRARRCSSGAGRSDPDRADIRDLYARLLTAIDKPLFHDGEWTLLTSRSRRHDQRRSDRVRLAAGQGPRARRRQRHRPRSAGSRRGRRPAGG